MANRVEIQNITRYLQSKILQTYSTLKLSCGYAEDAARLLRGWLYRTGEESSEWGSCYNVAVARLEKSRSGLIIDVTSQEFIAGKVSIVFNTKQTAYEIELKFGIPGWKLIQTYYKKGGLYVPDRITF